MKAKLLVLFLVVAFFGASLSGCGCFQQAQKPEPQVQQVAPPPPPPPPPPAPPPPPPPPAPTPPPPPPPPPAPKVVVFEQSVLFDFDKATLKPTGKEQLKAYFEKTRDDLSRADRIKITGYTDSTGPARYNQNLSLRRAKAVRDYLVSQGADAGKMEVSGMGKANPVASNATKAGRAKNRRVEIAVTGVEK